MASGALAESSAAAVTRTHRRRRGAVGLAFATRPRAKRPIVLRHIITSAIEGSAMPSRAHRLAASLANVFGRSGAYRVLTAVVLEIRAEPVAEKASLNFPFDLPCAELCSHLVVLRRQLHVWWTDKYRDGARARKMPTVLQRAAIYGVSDRVVSAGAVRHGRKRLFVRGAFPPLPFGHDGLWALPEAGPATDYCAGHQGRSPHG